MIDENIKKAKAMSNSILKKAFSGKLVLQDSNDEPVSILLERIRAERQAVPKPIRKLINLKKKSRQQKVVDLISVLESAENWLSAQDTFQECGVSDGTETDVIEKLYLELRDLQKKNRVEVERRGDEDWLRICSTGRS
jgi:type I restriction enzyme, S subunit